MSSLDTERYVIKDAVNSILGAYDIEDADMAKMITYIQGLKETFTELERDRCARIVGVHESPHTKSNCKLCLIEKNI